ncbi:MAG TPA: NAD(P)/FAD-dependent oxidoreductase [Candidatus Binataceae bacterium]|nr:NAD(P)/FAD-dependent oxidoreductase [Candidatus Binataceae bacterium]
MATSYDAIFVGSGISSLVGASILAKAGWSIGVFERNSWLGGNIRSGEITEPGFTHDLYSAWHPLFVAGEGYGLLKNDLTARGVEYLNAEYPAAGLLPDGTTAFISGDHQKNRDHFEQLAAGDGAAWDRAVAALMAKSEIAFGLMSSELWSMAGLGLAAKAVRKMGVRGALEFSSELFSTSREWLESNFQSRAIHGLLAPWVLHTGLGPDNATSGFMTALIAVTLELIGMPIPRGGAARLVEGFSKLLRDLGAELHTDAPVEQVIVRGGKVAGVRTAAGEFQARRAVICCVTPHQLYLKLLDRAVVPDWVVASASRFRYGRGDMQIHLALSEPPQWPGGDPRFLRTAMVHVAAGINGVSRAVNEAERGLLPADPTVVVGQPTAIDKSRAPDGSWIIWIQMQEMPNHPIGDAAGEIQSTNGTWTPELRERYADRVIAKLARQIPNLPGAIRKRVVFSPADLEAANPNLVGGDPYAGACTPDQFFIFRPIPGLPRHRTPISGLYHIGASTHPGPGLHGASGLLVAKDLLGARRVRRAFKTG